MVSEIYPRSILSFGLQQVNILPIVVCHSEGETHRWPWRWRSSWPGSLSGQLRCRWWLVYQWETVGEECIPASPALSPGGESWSKAQICFILHQHFAKQLKYYILETLIVDRIFHLTSIIIVNNGKTSLTQELTSPSDWNGLISVSNLFVWVVSSRWDVPAHTTSVATLICSSYNISRALYPRRFHIWEGAEEKSTSEERWTGAIYTRIKTQSWPLGRGKRCVDGVKLEDLRSFFPLRSKQLHVFPPDPPALKIKPGIKELKSKALPAPTVRLHT